MAKILFAEDEEFLMQSFIWELQDANHEVTVARDGEEAILHLQKDNHDFGLIVLDIMLPRGSHEGVPAVGEDIKTGEMGLEVLRQLRQEMGDETPVIVLTAVIDDDLKARMLDYGVEQYFTKPTSLTDFMNAVDTALASAESPS